MNITLKSTEVNTRTLTTVSPHNIDEAKLVVAEKSVTLNDDHSFDNLNHRPYLNRDTVLV